MFIRSVSLRLIPGTFGEFTKAFENDVLPALKKQPGFRGEVAFPVVEDVQISIVTLWDNNEQAGSHDTAAYPGMKAVEHVLAGPPEVHTCAAISSTFETIPAMASA